MESEMLKLGQVFRTVQLLAESMLDASALRELLGKKW
jgi:hypothetical protein